MYYACVYVYVCFLCAFLCVSFLYVRFQSVGNQAKQVVLCVTKSLAERFMRVGLIDLGVAAWLRGLLCVCVRVFGQ